MRTINGPKVVTTRKKHHCNACHRSFPKGSQMKVSVNTDGGEIWQWRLCKTCVKLLDEFPDYFYDEVQGCYWDGCVNDAPPNSFYFGGNKEEYLKDPTPENMLRILRRKESEEVEI